MRFSELLKEKYEIKEAAPPPPLARLAPGGSPSRASQAQREQDIRSKVEEQFRAKLLDLEGRLKRLAEEKALLEQKLKQGEQSQRSLEQEMLVRLEAERQKKEKMPAVPSEKEGTQKMIQTLQQRIKDLEKELLQKAAEVPSKEVALPKRVVTPAPEKIAPVPVPLPMPPPLERKAAAYDTSIESRLIKNYRQLTAVAELVFGSIDQSRAFDLSGLKGPLQELIRFASEWDAHLIQLTFGPYSKTNSFPNHAVNCAILSVILGLELKLSGQELEDLAAAAFLHDVGLIHVQEDLDYPKELTPDIKKEVFEHQRRGAELLQQLGPDLPEPVLRGIRQHHEAYNGKGYPEALKADEIHLYAKVVHVADVFEALTHERPYRKKIFEVSEAMKEIIERERGIYDPAVMKALMVRIGLYPIMSLVELSNKSIARVIRQNADFPLSPVVQIEFDEHGNKVKAPKTLNLAENALVHILGSVHDTASSFEKKRIVPPPPKASSGLDRLKKILPLVLSVAGAILLLYLLIKI